jgi:hypothetical protein
MRRDEDVWILDRPLPQHRRVDLEVFAHAAKGLLDFAVHPARRQVDEPCRQLQEKRLELRMLLGLGGSMPPAG